MAHNITVAVPHELMDVIDGSGKNALPCSSELLNYGSKVL